MVFSLSLPVLQLLYPCFSISARFVSNVLQRKLQMQTHFRESQHRSLATSAENAFT